MAKIDIDLARVVAQRQPDWTASQIANFIADLQDLANSPDETPKEPPVKKQYVMIVNDPYGKIKETGFEFSGWIVQIPEDDAPHTALDRLHKGAYDFNITPKGLRLPIKTVSEACEFGSAKIYKEHKVWVKTKEPILLIRTNGRIPRETESE